LKILLPQLTTVVKQNAVRITGLMVQFLTLNKHIVVYIYVHTYNYDICHSHSTFNNLTIANDKSIK